MKTNFTTKNSPQACALKIKEVSVRLGQLDILNGINAHIPKGGQTIIIGPNGGGKTTLIKALLNDIPYRGEFIFEAKKNPRLGYVPQRLDFDRHLPLTVLEFLSLGLTDRPLWAGISKKIKTNCQALLDEVKAVNLLKRRLGELSGGELQRVLLASALSQHPEFLILDEPATGVDVYGEQLLCELLDGLKERLTLLMVSHDLPTAKAHADWIICLNRRVIAEGNSEDIFNSNAIAQTFGLHSL